jgi:hypothetical protein
MYKCLGDDQGFSKKGEVSSNIVSSFSIVTSGREMIGLSLTG